MDPHMIDSVIGVHLNGALFVSQPVPRLMPAARLWTATNSSMWVNNRRHDHQVARAGRGDVGDPIAFLLVARQLFAFEIQEIEWSPTPDTPAASTARMGRIDYRYACWPVRRAVMSARMTTGNSRPFALCTVIRRTPSLPSSSIGASPASPLAARRQLARRSRGTTCRRSTSYCRASSATCSTLASACSPRGRSTNPTCARVALSSAGDRVGHRHASCGGGAGRRAAERIGNRLRCRVGASARHDSARMPQAGGTERMQAPVAMAILEQRLVVDREQRAPQRRKHRQLVVGPLDGGKRRARSSRPLRARGRTCPPTSRCGTPRASSASTYGRVTSCPSSRSAGTGWQTCLRLHRHAARRRRCARSRSSRSRHQPVDEGADGVGQRLLDRDLAMRAHRRTARHRQRDDRRLVAAVVAGRRRSGT